MELWNDDKALADFVARHLPERPRDYLFVPWHEWHPPFTEENRQREAIAAARQGNFKLLGLLRKQVVRLGAEAEALIDESLLGTFKVQKPSGKTTGRPKQSESQRRANNSIYDATDEVPAIDDILRQHFPGQRGYNDRAIDIAALLAGVDRNRLANHLEYQRKLSSRTKL